MHTAILDFQELFLSKDLNFFSKKVSLEEIYFSSTRTSTWFIFWLIKICLNGFPDDWSHWRTERDTFIIEQRLKLKPELRQMNECWGVFGVGDIQLWRYFAFAELWKALLKNIPGPCWWFCPELPMSWAVDDTTPLLILKALLWRHSWHELRQSPDLPER